MEMIAAGETVDGPAAARVGLVDACVPAGRADEAARLLLEKSLATGDHQARLNGPVLVWDRLWPAHWSLPEVAF